MIRSTPSKAVGESVYQMVQGNFDRTAAITTSLKDAILPNPSKSKHHRRHLSFTNRVTLQVDSGAVYHGSSPRASGSEKQNAWLKEVIGNTRRSFVLFHTWWGRRKEEIAMSDLGLEAIDLVL